MISSSLLLQMVVMI